MPIKYPTEFKVKAVRRYEKGESIKELCKELNISQSTLYHWRKQYCSIQTDTRTYTPAEFDAISRRLRKVEHELEVIRLSGYIARIPLQDKLATLEHLHNEMADLYSVHELCEALDVSRGTFYNHIFRRVDRSKYEEEKTQLMLKVKQIFDDSEQRYLKRVTPIFVAYKTITISVLAFLLVSGCALLYLHPGDHELMMELLMFLIVGPACISPLMELVEFGADLRNLAVRMDQIDEVLNMQPISEGTETAPKGGAEIVFQDVSFSYQNAADPLRRMALDHLTMEIPAGNFAALVGPSGGGKSTAGQLIARFWDVESGSITIAGHDIREYSMEALMNTIAFVFQDTHIFAESVYDNIAMHRKVHREDVEKAAKAARCHDFILSLPNGYDTKLGDGGHKLSGGEAQRIAIARAILKDAPIVVLDEAMAFTDAENELALREGMAELLKGKTVLMIAHRLYSIQDADCIFVLENGKLREHGSHTELLKANGLYAHLWAIQNETESWQMKGGPAYV